MDNNSDILTDDYVADLLAKDASDCSLKYSALGMEAYTSSSSSGKKYRHPPFLVSAGR
jgi:hypothetical protein